MNVETIIENFHTLLYGFGNYSWRQPKESGGVKDNGKQIRGIKRTIKKLRGEEEVWECKRECDKGRDRKRITKRRK